MQGHRDARSLIAHRLIKRQLPAVQSSVSSAALMPQRSLWVPPGAIAFQAGSVLHENRGQGRTAARSAKASTTLER